MSVDPIDIDALVRDDRIEQIGMNYVMSYERGRG